MISKIGSGTSSFENNLIKIIKDFTNNIQRIKMTAMTADVISSDLSFN